MKGIDERSLAIVAERPCFPAHGIAEEKLVWFTVATGGVAREGFVNIRRISRQVLRKLSAGDPSAT